MNEDELFLAYRNTPVERRTIRPIMVRCSAPLCMTMIDSATGRDRCQFHIRRPKP